MSTPTTSTGDPVTEVQELIEQYVALWNEPDGDVRRKRIRELWAAGGSQVLEPPQGVRDAARAIGFPSPTLQVRGYDELEYRVTRAYDEFVAPGQFTFRARDNGRRLDNVVKLGWDMVPAGGGDAVGGGIDVLVLDAHGSIVTDYQFIDG